MLALMFCVALAQGPEVGDAPARPSDARPVEASAVRELTDDEAKAAIAEFQKVAKAKAAPLRERVTAIEQLATGRHRTFVTVLVEVTRREKTLSVRRVAAQALGNQPPKQARPAILKLLGDEGVKDELLVLGDLVTALDRAGYEARDWKVIDGLFERDYDADRVPLQRAMLALIANHKEKQAVDLLLRNLGEPIPVNVDDPANPPAEYWEARWKAWQVWREDVKNALFEITRQRFSTPEEARIWIKKNGKKIGIQ